MNKVDWQDILSTIIIVISIYAAGFGLAYIFDCRHVKANTLHVQTLDTVNREEYLHDRRVTYDKLARISKKVDFMWNAVFFDKKQDFWIEKVEKK